MFQKYRYVLAVYREQSFTGAAQKLYISQPSLSVAIRNIERKLGGPLFERSGSGVKPTEIGDAYIAAARKMLLAEEEFQRQYLDIHDLHTGKLTVGGTNHISSYVLPKIITLFRERFPNVEITLVEANSVRLREMLRNEEVDLIMDNSENGEEQYEEYPLTREHILLCVPEEAPVNRELTRFQILPDEILSGRADLEAVPPVSLSRFRDEKFILLKHGNDMYARAGAIFQENGMTPKVVFRVDQLNMSFALTESGVGVSFVTDTLFKYRKHRENVILYRPDTPHSNRMLCAVHKKNRYRTRAMSEFIAAAHEIVKD